MHFIMEKTDEVGWKWKKLFLFTPSRQFFVS
jgi:hypothetical protein